MVTAERPLHRHYVRHDIRREIGVGRTDAEAQSPIKRNGLSKQMSGLKAHMFVAVFSGGAEKCRT